MGDDGCPDFPGKLLAVQEPSQDLRLQALGRLQLPATGAEHSAARQSLLCCSRRHSAVVACCASGLAAFSLPPLLPAARQAHKLTPPRKLDAFHYRRHALPAQPNLVDVSSDGMTVAVAVGGSVLLYSMAELLPADGASQSAAPLATFKVHSSATIDDLRWNPASPADASLTWSNTFVVLCQGQLQLYGAARDEQSFKLLSTWSSPENNPATCCCYTWSGTKGKEIVVGLADGSLQRLACTTELAPKKIPLATSENPSGVPPYIDCVAEMIESGPEHIRRLADVCWLDTYVFAQRHGNGAEALFTVSQRKDDKSPAHHQVFSMLDEQFAEFREGSQQAERLLMEYIPEWRLLLGMGSNAGRLDLLQRGSSEAWTMLVPSEDFQAKAPLNEESKTVSPVLGLALSFNSTTPEVVEDEQRTFTVPPSPIVLLLAADGTLSLFACVDTAHDQGTVKEDEKMALKDGAYTFIKPAEPLAAIKTATTKALSVTGAVAAGPTKSLAAPSAPLAAAPAAAPSAALAAAPAPAKPAVPSTFSFSLPTSAPDKGTAAFNLPAASGSLPRSATVSFNVPPAAAVAQSPGANPAAPATEASKPTSAFSLPQKPLSVGLNLPGAGGKPVNNAFAVSATAGALAKPSTGAASNTGPAAAPAPNTPASTSATSSKPFTMPSAASAGAAPGASNSSLSTAFRLPGQPMTMGAAPVARIMTEPAKTSGQPSSTAEKDPNRVLSAPAVADKDNNKLAQQPSTLTMKSPAGPTELAKLQSGSQSTLNQSGTAAAPSQLPAASAMSPGRQASGTTQQPGKQKTQDADELDEVDKERLETMSREIEGFDQELMKLLNDCRKLDARNDMEQGQHTNRELAAAQEELDRCRDVQDQLSEVEQQLWRDREAMHHISQRVSTHIDRRRRQVDYAVYVRHRPLDYASAMKLETLNQLLNEIQQSMTQVREQLGQQPSWPGNMSRLDLLADCRALNEDQAQYIRNLMDRAAEVERSLNRELISEAAAKLNNLSFAASTSPFSAGLSSSKRISPAKHTTSSPGSAQMRRIRSSLMSSGRSARVTKADNAFLQPPAFTLSPTPKKTTADSATASSKLAGAGQSPAFSLAKEPQATPLSSATRSSQIPSAQSQAPPRAYTGFSATAAQPDSSTPVKSTADVPRFFSLPNPQQPLTGTRAEAAAGANKGPALPVSHTGALNFSAPSASAVASKLGGLSFGTSSQKSSGTPGAGLSWGTVPVTTTSPALSGLVLPASMQSGAATASTSAGRDRASTLPSVMGGDEAGASAVASSAAAATGAGTMPSAGGKLAFAVPPPSSTPGGALSFKLPTSSLQQPQQQPSAAANASSLALPQGKAASALNVGQPAVKEVDTSTTTGSTAAAGSGAAAAPAPASASVGSKDEAGQDEGEGEPSDDEEGYNEEDEADLEYDEGEYDEGDEEEAEQGYEGEDDEAEVNSQASDSEVAAGDNPNFGTAQSAPPPAWISAGKSAGSAPGAASSTAAQPGLVGNKPPTSGTLPTAPGQSVLGKSLTNTGASLFGSGTTGGSNLFGKGTASTAFPVAATKAATGAGSASSAATNSATAPSATPSLGQGAATGANKPLSFTLGAGTNQPAAAGGPAVAGAKASSSLFGQTATAKPAAAGVADNQVPPLKPAATTSLFGSLGSALPKPATAAAAASSTSAAPTAGASTVPAASTSGGLQPKPSASSLPLGTAVARTGAGAPPPPRMLNLLDDGDDENDESPGEVPQSANADDDTLSLGGLDMLGSKTTATSGSAKPATTGTAIGGSSTGPSLFGGSGLLGGPNTSGTSGAGGLFGSSSAGKAAGSATSFGGGLGSGLSLGGTPTTTTTTTTTMAGGSLFGAASSSPAGGLGGSGSALFKPTVTTASAFGTAPATSACGLPTASTGLFGSTAPATTAAGSAFGGNSTAGSFGLAGSTSGAFGQATPKAGVFAPSTAAGGFGGSGGAGFPSGSGAFGAGGSSSAGGVFGSSSTMPAATLASSGFGNAGASPLGAASAFGGGMGMAGGGGFGGSNPNSGFGAAASGSSTSPWGSSFGQRPTFGNSLPSVAMTANTGFASHGGGGAGAGAPSGGFGGFAAMAQQGGGGFAAFAQPGAASGGFGALGRGMSTSPQGPPGGGGLYGMARK